MLTRLQPLSALTRRLGLGLALAIAATASWSAPITKQLVVTVITVCDDAGANCAWQGPLGNLFFEAEADKIWAQAGIDIKFELGANLNNTTLLNGQNSVADFTGALGGTGTTMYLANTLTPGLFGEAYLDAGGVVVNMNAIMNFNGGIGRLDTIAHELGHNLGIGHTDSDANFLMASGGIRNIPDSLGEICPDGPCYDLLAQSHIDIARRSRLLIDFQQTVPEPAALGLALAALLAGGAVRRRRV